MKCLRYAKELQYQLGCGTALAQPSPTASGFLWAVLINHCMNLQSKLLLKIMSNLKTSKK